MAASIADLRNIIDCIRKIAGSDKLGNVKSDICNVDSVDEENGQIDCTSLLSEAKIKYLKVMLNAEGNDGVISIPAKDSTVVIIQLKNNQCFVVSCSDIDKYIVVIDNANSFEFSSAGFVFNKGLLGGLPVSSLVAARLNLLETAVTTLGIPMTPTVPTMIENTSIKQ